MDGSDSKESTYNTEDQCLIPGLGKFPGEENGNPFLYFLPGKSHGQRSLVGYSPWGCKEVETTEGLTLSSLVVVCGLLTAVAYLVAEHDSRM